MIGAELEPGVREVLQALHGRLPLTVLTNNARGAAMEALERTGIASCFEWVAGREQMTALKPSPSGVTYLLSRYSDVRPHRWLSIGDSWIDAAAARDGGVAFLAYNARMEELERRQLPTVGHIRSITELYEYLQA
jgi:phosphoglycolate phosphatase